jgi:CTP-dependent riboflavin kinase
LENAQMVGDNARADCLPAAELGILAILVRTSGQFVPYAADLRTAADLIRARHRTFANHGRTSARLHGRVQSGTGDASHWLAKFNAAYARKVGHPVFPGSLNVALSEPFDWFSEDNVRRTTWFGRDEYGGERDILLIPCRLVSLHNEPAWLWTPTTAARDRADPWVVEVIASKGLRAEFGLRDGSPVEIELLET